jgi:hypothetical protein
MTVQPYTAKLLEWLSAESVNELFKRAKGPSTLEQRLAERMAHVAMELETAEAALADSLATLRRNLEKQLSNHQQGLTVYPVWTTQAATAVDQAQQTIAAKWETAHILAGIINPKAV